jgi:hypothetical protein
VLLVTLRLLGYTAETFGTDERANLTSGVAQLLGCSSAALFIAAVRSESDNVVAASSGTRRSGLFAATQDMFVLVDIAVDAVAAGLAADALAAALAALSQSSLLAFLRDAGLTKLIGAAFSAANIGRGSDEAAVAAPAPQPGAVLPAAVSYSSRSDTRAAQLLSLSMQWSVVLAVVMVVAWFCGIACGVRFRQSIQMTRYVPLRADIPAHAALSTAGAVLILQ